MREMCSILNLRCGEVRHIEGMGYFAWSVRSDEHGRYHLSSCVYDRYREAIEEAREALSWKGAK